MENNYQHEFENYNFRGKREGEEIILILRRHKLILLAMAIPLAIGFFVLTIVYFFMPALLSFLTLGIDIHAVNVVISFLYLGLWLSTFVAWVDYYYDTWIVTNQRIVSIEQKGLFKRDISELEHSKIQDVTTEVHGVIPTLLKFGYVHIQTAGEKSRFVFKQVPNPVKVRSMIMTLQKTAIKKQKKEEGEIFRGKA